MRGIQSIVDKFRQMKASKLVVASAFVMAVTLAGVGVYQFNQTAADAASPCNAQTNNIVPNGTHSYADVTRNYNANTCGDLKAIYNHYRITPQLAAGDKVYNGTSNNKGEVIANGRVVANNAESIGRQPIKNSRPISINGQRYYQTSHVGGAAFANPNSSLPTLVVLDKDGNFKYAIVKACGNPIYARPVPPPKPPVKDIQVCDLTTKQIITIKEDQFNPNQHSKNLEDCKEIKVCDLTTKQVITIKESEFNPNHHSKNLDDCKEVLIQVCDLTTKTIITINEDQFDPKKHSKNLEDCKTPEKIVVCDLTDNTVKTIDKDQYDPKKHSTNLKDCEPKCPIPGKEHLPKDSKDCYEPCPIPGKEHLPANSAECEVPVAPTPAPVAPTPTVLPQTGAGDLVSAGIGLSAMGVAAYYYAASRRLL